MAKDKYKKGIKVNDTPELMAQLVNDGSEPESKLDDILDGMKNEKDIVKRLDREFTNYCDTDIFRDYVDYEGYELVPLEKKMESNTVSLKMTYSLTYRFKFTTHIFNKKQNRIVDMAEEIVQDIPTPYKRYFTFINGHRYISLPQIADIMFKNKDSCVIKTLHTPLKLKRDKRRTFKTVDSDITITAAPFILDMFKKPLPFLAYFFAEFGVNKTFEMFGLEGVLAYNDINACPKMPNVISYKVNGHTALSVSIIPMQNTVFMSFVATLLRMHKRYMTVKDAYNQEFWQAYIGENFANGNRDNHEVKLTKYFDISTNLKKIMDDDTIYHLGVYAGSMNESADVYSAMRWLFMNFGKLLHNDNLHINNKRIRLNEYITIPLLKRFQDKKAMFLRNIDERRLSDIFKIAQECIVKEGVMNNGISRYIGITNDNVVLHALMATSAGPAAQGGNDGRKDVNKRHTITPENLFIHHTDLGVYNPNYAPAGTAGVSKMFTTGAQINRDGTINLKEYPEDPDADDGGIGYIKMRREGKFND